jgi:hypothetical protein
MSKFAEMSATCICGKETTFHIKKPNHFTPTHAKAYCLCGSSYLITCSINSKDTDKVLVDAKIIELSPRAKKAAADAIKLRADA